MEHTVSATEMREKFAEFLDSIETRRVLISRHGQPKACLISVRELAALEETVAVLQDTELMRAIEKGLEDIRAGRVRDAREVFAELDAGFTDEE